MAQEDGGRGFVAKGRGLLLLLIIYFIFYYLFGLIRYYERRGYRDWLLIVREN